MTYLRVSATTMKQIHLIESGGTTFLVCFNKYTNSTILPLYDDFRFNYPFSFYSFQIYSF